MLRLFLSTLAAFFGVQTQARRQQDFQSHSPLPFIIMGVILAALLVLSLILTVNWVIAP
ncbi:DUF2970 domain-containing protein [Shewanella sp. AS1]|nr:DUF2970 domain-containing protein [Shewanella sp. AS1]